MFQTVIAIVSDDPGSPLSVIVTCKVALPSTEIGPQSLSQMNLLCLIDIRSISMYILHMSMAEAHVDLMRLRSDLVSTGEAASILGITYWTASKLVRQGKLPGVKIGRFYLIPRASLEEFAKSYVPKLGHPRMKRKYTKRSPKWNIK